MTRMEAISRLRFGCAITKKFEGSILYPPTPSMLRIHKFSVALVATENNVSCHIYSDSFGAEKSIALTTRQVLTTIRHWYPRKEDRKQLIPQYDFLR